MQTINSPAITSGHTEAAIQNGSSYTNGPLAIATCFCDHPSKNAELHERVPLSNKRCRISSSSEDDSVEPRHTILERDQDSDAVSTVLESPSTVDPYTDFTDFPNSVEQPVEKAPWLEIEEFLHYYFISVFEELQLDFQDEQFLSDLQSGLREDRFEYVVLMEDAYVYDESPDAWVNQEDLGNVEFQGVMEALVVINSDIVYEELGVQDENGHNHELQNNEDEQVDLPDLNEDPIHQLDDYDEFDNVLEMDFADIFQGLDDTQL